MKLAVEIYTEKPLSVKEEAYFKTALLIDGAVLKGSEGSDRFGFPFIATSEKRVACLGRHFHYTLSSFPAGMGPIEARPGSFFDLSEVPEYFSLALETNLILDPGIFRDTLGVRFVNEQGKRYDISLGRPDVPVYWEGRGKFTLSLSGIIHSGFLKAISLAKEKNGFAAAGKA